MTATGTIRVGCSGWNYRHWRGVFYPMELPQRRWFEHYARTFDTVEINNSFYRLPSGATFAKWREQAPSGFCYAVKANRFLTQAKKLKDCEEPLKRMMANVLCLGKRLGPILYQLPPRFRINCERLEEFLKLLPDKPVAVFEFRDKSWLTEDVVQLLDRHGASFCAHDMKGSATPRWAAGPVAYVRFHGTDGKYHGRYSDARLSDWCEWMIREARAGRRVWAYFNNDVQAHAVEDALTLRSMVAQALR